MFGKKSREKKLEEIIRYWQDYIRGSSIESLEITNWSYGFRVENDDRPAPPPQEPVPEPYSRRKAKVKAFELRELAQEYRASRNPELLEGLDPARYEIVRSKNVGTFYDLHSIFRRVIDEEFKLQLEEIESLETNLEKRIIKYDNTRMTHRARRLLARKRRALEKEYSHVEKKYDDFKKAIRGVAYKGQVLGFTEALRLYTEAVCETDGSVDGILIDKDAVDPVNGMVVEWGTPYLILNKIDKPREKEIDAVRSLYKEIGITTEYKETLENIRAYLLK